MLLRQDKAALRASVSHVVGLRPEEEVFGVEARRVVAAVADENVLSERPDEQFVRDAMHSSHAPSSTNLSVALWVPTAPPLPASRRGDEAATEQNAAELVIGARSRTGKEFTPERLSVTMPAPSPVVRIAEPPPMGGASTSRDRALHCSQRRRGDR